MQIDGEYMIRKPGRLKRGDRVAIVSPSKSLPSVLPRLAEIGISNIREYFDLEPVIFPHAFSDMEYTYLHPEARAMDMNDAFADSSIGGLISTIGGDESVRILKHLDSSIIESNPKLFMGFSDTSTITAYLHSRNIASIYGGAIMAGFAQMRNFPDDFVKYWETMLLKDSSGFVMERFEQFSEGYPNWSHTADFSAVNTPVKSYHWNWVNGDRMQGKIFAANLETLDLLRGSVYFPQLSNLDDSILLLETSENVPTPYQVEVMVRGLGINGVLERINGLAFGRFRGYSKEMRSDVVSRIMRILKFEVGSEEKPLVEGLDFGHTDPYFPVPVGIHARIQGDKFTLLESLTE